jgi:hexosaminidase
MRTEIKMMSAIAVVATLLCAAVRAEGPAIIPQPKSIALHAGTVKIANGTALCATAGADAGFVASYTAALVRRTRGLTLVVRTAGCRPSAGHPVITLHLDPAATMPAEGYTLDVSASGITITASTRAGLFYGGVTLWQLLTQTPGQVGPVTIQFMHIEDAPRLKWRGLMLDSARHFQPAAFVETLIDQMALHKLNILHWHLTDDQGWRIEIKRYPRLTQVGAWSVPAGPAAAADIDPKTHKPREYGGFYTQAQIRHLVNYATSRNITIVPELDMPGHSTAAIAAYPELGSSPTPPEHPSNQWGVHSNIYNLDESTFTFLENVLTEVMAIFPSPYIHVGGDEATKDQWKASTEIQARMHELGLTEEDAAQSYFIQRIEKFLNAHQRKLVGWDEILQGGLAQNATVMSWHGVDGGITAAKAGHDAVLTPQRPLYFNFRQSDATDEPPGRAPLNTLSDVYAFEPAPVAKLTLEELKHIIGVQANLWTEHVRTEERVEHMLFPRTAALAEVAWSPEKRDWHSFLVRMVPQYARYRALHLPAAESAFEVRTTETLNATAHTAQVTLTNQVNFGTIRYTLNGAAPSVASAVYTSPLSLPLPSKIRAAAFAGGRPITSAITRSVDELSIRRRDSREMQLCSENPSLQMEDDAPVRGERAVFLVNHMNPCWIYKGADLQSITRIEAGVGQIPFNLKIGNSKPVLHPPATPSGELQVYLNKCTGKPILTLSLQPALSNNAITTLRADFPALTGTHDLCFNFTRANNDFIWAVNWVQLVPASK